MSIATLNRLGELILLESGALMADWRRQVRQLPSARHLDRPTLDDHIPVLLEELAEALQNHCEKSVPDLMLEGTPPSHGLHRLADGFDIDEVVAEYNILRGSIHDLAERHGMTIRGKDFHILNRVIDVAIGLAVQTYATQRAMEVQQRREEYLAFVAHDLRTPLNAISLSLRFFSERSKTATPDPQMMRALTTLQRNVRHLEELVEQVLKENTSITSEATDRLAPRRFDLWPQVEAALHDLRPVADTNGVELVNEVPIDLMTYADAGMLTRILHNLVSNAIRYAMHGQVAVGACANDGDGAVECWISDNGTGIPPGSLDTVFDKFESDGEINGGKGLGLAIVKEFVEAHGGKVTVESEPNVKTTFRFTLPGPEGA
jgi:signal transduction histidine kinase